MNIVATGLLVAMASLFVSAHTLETGLSELGLTSRFAEAAMVGGLADWFAVTALFRHPLGLPIPHTAIIPRNKDRIGEALAGFIRENFLIRLGRGAADAAARRRERGRALPPPTPRGGRHAMPRRGFAAASPTYSKASMTSGWAASSKARSRRACGRWRLRRYSATRWRSAINDERHVPMLEAAIRWTARALDANEQLIRDMVRRRGELGAENSPGSTPGWPTRTSMA